MFSARQFPRALQPMVITSDDPPSGEFFSGYAFAGTDLVLGATGFAEYRNAHGEGLTHHSDGCYVLGKASDGGKFVVGGDYKGSCKIFIYESGDRWAVANSFGRLIDTARGKGWKVSPRWASVDSWGVTEFARFWDQQKSAATSVREIRLLPKGGLIVLNGGSLTEIAPAPDTTEVDYGKYLEHLSTFLSTWIGRVGTVIFDDVLRAEFEVTGGQDSRTVLALLLAARQYFGGIPEGKLAIVSSRAPSRAADLEVAEDLARTFNLPLNARGFDRGPVVGLSSVEQFEDWLTFGFGSYRPIYLSPQRRYSSTVLFGGHGGESSRRAFAPYETLPELVRGYEREFVRHESFEETLAEVEGVRVELQRRYPGTTELLAHFQEFRDRFHAGLHPQMRRRAVALAGKDLHRATQSLPQELLLQAQTLRDITAQCSPGLLRRPYEVERKGPSSFNLSHLAPPLVISPRAGRVFGEKEQAWQAPADPRSAWDLAVEWFHDAADRVDVDVLPRERVDQVARLVGDIKDEPGSIRAALARPMHQVLLADFLMCDDRRLGSLADLQGS